MPQGGQIQQQIIGQSTMGITSSPAMLQYPQAQIFQQTQIGQMQQVCFEL